jgi:hypothetical protein
VIGRARAQVYLCFLGAITGLALILAVVCALT